MNKYKLHFIAKQVLPTEEIILYPLQDIEVPEDKVAVTLESIAELYAKLLDTTIETRCVKVE